MLTRILPPRIENRFTGPRVALWIFALVVLVKMGMALGTLIATRKVAEGPDGIALAQLGDAGGRAMLAMLSLVGLSQLVLGALGILALVRYRAMVPLLFLVFLLEQLARRWLLLVHPIARTGAAPGGAINLILLGLMLVGFLVSLVGRSGPASSSSNGDAGQPGRG